MGEAWREETEGQKEQREIGLSTDEKKEYFVKIKKYFPSMILDNFEKRLAVK